jgi:hypothetical protein
MKLVTKDIQHRCIGSDYEAIQNVWNIVFEESDFDNPKMFLKFRWAEVCQSHHPNLKGTDGNSEINWHWHYKGERTTAFNRNTKDKLKQTFIKMVDRFILDIDKPTHLAFIPNPTTK